MRASRSAENDRVIGDRYEITQLSIRVYRNCCSGIGGNAAHWVACHPIVYWSNRMKQVAMDMVIAAMAIWSVVAVVFALVMIMADK